MRSIPHALCAAGLVLIFLAGCSNSNVGAPPASQVVTIDDYEAFVTDAVSLLRGLEWRMQSVDRAGGIIETQPATSAHFPEFWRVDSPGGYNYLESSLSTVRRTVTVRITPAPDESGDPSASQPDGTSSTESALAADTTPSDAESSQDSTTETAAPASAPTVTAAARHYRLQVEVEKERYSAPERQVTTASGALGLYSQKTPTIYGYRKSKPGDVQWISLGRDELLESDLLQRLLRASKHVE